jgi:cytochrome c biogenesis protein CcmG/thiol:disulfide interchange protein DsbE
MRDDVAVDEVDSERVDHDAVAAPGARRSRIAPFVALAIAVVVAGMFIVFARADPNKAEQVETRWQDRPAPELVGPLDRLDADGNTVESTFDITRRRGSWVVLNFFDLTCAPCVQEHPDLVAFAGNLQRSDTGLDDVELYSVVWGKQRPESRDYLRENDATWPIVLDDGTIATQLGVGRVPETWIIDPNGFVRARLAGTVTATGLTTFLAQLQGVAPVTIPEDA